MNPRPDRGRAAPPTVRPLWRTVWIDLLLYPTHTLPTAAAPIAIGAGLAVHDGVFRAGPMLLAFVASWLVHCGGIFLDNYLLVTRHPDLPEHPELLRGLAEGTLTRRRLFAAMLASFAAAILVGGWLVPVIGSPAVVLGLVGIGASVFYALGPWSMVRLGIAEPVFWVMFGVVAVVGCYDAQAVVALGYAPGWLPALAALPARALYLGLGEGALVAAVLVIDDIRDIDFDRAKGWRTGTVRFGLGWGRNEFTGLVAFAYVMPLWLWLGAGDSAWMLLPLLTLPGAAPVVRAVRTSGNREALVPVSPRMAMLSLTYAVLMGAGIALA